MKNLDLLAVLVHFLQEKKQIIDGELASLREEVSILTAKQGEVLKKTYDKERQAASISEEAIAKYEDFWKSLGPNDRFPCPSCYLFHNKNSPLKPLPGNNSGSFVKCTICKEKYWVPIY